MEKLQSVALFESGYTTNPPTPLGWADKKLLFLTAIVFSNVTEMFLLPNNHAPWSLKKRY